MILHFLLVRRQTLSSGHRRINGDVAGGVFGMDCSVYTFSSGSNGWLGMVPRSVKGTRSVACEAMRAARLARLSGGGGQGGYAGDATCDVL